MSLVALNTDFAVFEQEKSGSNLDSFAALRDLVAIKSWKDVIDFLQIHGSDPAFLVSTDGRFNSFDQPREYYEYRCKQPFRFSNNKIEHLDKEIARRSDVEILDDMVRDDYRDKDVDQIFLNDLSTFKNDITAFLKLGAVALGSPIPEGMFIELPTSAFYDEHWIGAVFERPVGESRTFALALEDYGVSNQGIFGDESFVQGTNPFTSSIKCRDYENVYFEVEEYPHDTLGHANFLFSDYLALVTVPLNYDECEAKRLLAATMVEVLLNHSIDFLEGYSFNMPYFGQEHEDRYVFDPAFGFKFIKGRPHRFWVEELYDEAVRLITSKQLSLCPVCGSPVLYRDKRGCKPRVYCSNSCKSQATTKRREKTMRLAIKGVAIEDAIELVGVDYEQSIRKWYAEALSVHTLASENQSEVMQVD